MTSTVYTVTTAHARSTDFAQLLVGVCERRPSGLFGAFGNRDDSTVAVVELYGEKNVIDPEERGFMMAHDFFIPSNEMIEKFSGPSMPICKTECTDESEQLPRLVTLSLDWAKNLMRSFAGCSLSFRPYGESTLVSDLVRVACYDWAGVDAFDFHAEEQNDE